jgi:hypothetical protein
MRERARTDGRPHPIIIVFQNRGSIDSVGLRLLLVFSNNIYLLLLDTITVREENKT